jgi:hypothetical protein
LCIGLAIYFLAVSYIPYCIVEDIKAECPKWGQNWKEEGHLIADLYLSLNLK